VNNSLGAAIQTNLTLKTKPWDLYEAFVMSCVLNSAKTDGYTITFQCIDNTVSPPQFVIRRGPGAIYSPHFSYARIGHGACDPLEVHVGIGVEGQSRVVHEADVCLLVETEAANARSQQFSPRTKSLIGLIECKYYSSNLQLGLLREFIGLTTDLRSVGTRHWLVSNVTHPELPTLLKHHNRDWVDKVLPRKVGQVGQDGRGRFESAIEALLHRYRR
jgi:hypothetical protein